MAERKLREWELLSIVPSMIERVYSGKYGCMCGCLGKYYESGPMIKKVLNILKDDPNVRLQDGYILCIDFEKSNDYPRNYVAYLKQEHKLDPNG